MRRLAAAVCLALSGCGGLDTLPEPPPRPEPRAAERRKAHIDPIGMSAVLWLIGDTYSRWDPPAEPSPTLARLAAMGTPEGIRLWNRYTHIGEVLVEALAIGQEAPLDNPITEAARSSRHLEIRSAALLAVAARGRAADRPVFEEVLMGTDPVLLFSLAEALESWRPAEALGLLERVVRESRSSLARVQAAQALLRRGRPEGRGELLKQLDGGDWVARAMAARYLGLLGEPDDYPLLLDRLTRDQANGFVVAEIALGALRLFPRHRRGAVGLSPGSPPSPDESDLEPLVITAPRLKIPETALIDGRINAVLMRLLEERGASGPSAQDVQDPSFAALAALVSPQGVALKTRYRHLALLLADGLAGTSDLFLRERLLQIARSAKDGGIRAAAMLAVAYGGNATDRVLFEDALASKDPAVRLGGIEAYRRWGAAARLGDPFDRLQPEPDDPLMLFLTRGRIPADRWLEDGDWVARALAMRSLRGRLDDVASGKLGTRWARERNRFVRAEMCAIYLGVD